MSKSDWQGEIIAQADRLTAQLASLKEAEPGCASSSHFTSAAQAITAAKATSDVGGWQSVRAWWSGANVESAWNALQLAQEEITLMLPHVELIAQRPALRELAGRTFQAERNHDEQAILRADFTALDAHRVLEGHHASSNVQHQNVRKFRNLIYVLLGIVTALVLALALGRVTAWSICGLGALAGALSIVLSMRGGTLHGPYNLGLPQALLKIASGAATGLLAVIVLDVVSGSAVSGEREGMYAVIFGFSQQAFTRLVDQQANILAGKTPTRGRNSTTPDTSDPTQ